MNRQEIKLSVEIQAEGERHVRTEEKIQIVQL